MAASFPVDRILPGVADSLARNRLVILQSPPGSGKTTRVAPYLLDAAWLKGRKILMLEPRRLAARAAAAYMARQRGERVGQTVGYQIRLDRQVGPSTRIEILTEGLLAQRLLSDPELRDTGLIIFDEFHERNLPGDFGLALARDTRSAFRPDLRLVIMSATLQPEALAAALGPADIHTSEARAWPVETRYLSRPALAQLPALAADFVRRALRDERGGILVFLPGEGEIRRTLEALRAGPLPPDTSLHPLYAALPREEQDAAIEPPPPGRRKVVLATSIAESSLTIEGVRVVIDSGLMRVPRFSPRSGMPRLETLRITRDRADQRRGRAGRTEPGVCYRLWDEATDRQLSEEALPEILDADLAPIVLASADWGTADRLGLPWLTPPPDAAWRQATALLQELGALTRAEPVAITPRGHALARLPVHPRLAHMIAEAARAGAAQTACLLAAAVAEAPADPAYRRESDARRLLERAEHTDDGFGHRVRELARAWGAPYPRPDRTRLSEGQLLAWAFPDRVARRRGTPGSYVLRSGRGVLLDTAEPLCREDWLVAVELQDRAAAEAQIRLAAALTQEEVEEVFADDFETATQTSWDKRTESVQAVRQLRLGAIVMREGGQSKPDSAAILAALEEGVRQKGIDQLPWSPASRAIQARVTFLHRALPEAGWPDFSNEALLAKLDEWFAPFADGIARWARVQAMPLTEMLMAYLAKSGFTRRQLDEAAPPDLVVPSGSHVRIRYEAEEPHVDVRIQEVFGLAKTPSVAGGRVPIVLHLLSPAQRPVQVTKDLASFWATGYAYVRKDLRGRYPKHYWPENPYEAVATRRVRPRPPGK